MGVCPQFNSFILVTSIGSCLVHRIRLDVGNFSSNSDNFSNNKLVMVFLYAMKLKIMEKLKPLRPLHELTGK